MTVPFLQFNQPANLSEVLIAQLVVLRDVGVPELLGIDRHQYYADGARLITNQCHWSKDSLVDVGLGQVMFSDSRIPVEFLREKTGIHSRIALSAYYPRPKTLLPKGISIFQFQPGEKFAHRSVDGAMTGFSESEQGGTIADGLLTSLYWGNHFLNEMNMIFPNSLAGDGRVATLSLNHGQPVIDSFPTNCYEAGFGCFTREKVQL